MVVRDLGGDMVSRQVAIGVQDYAILIENKYFYIDKTGDFAIIRIWKAHVVVSGRR